MAVLYEYCEKGDGKCNEDVIGHIDNCFWIIDGATDVFLKNHLNKINEVCWYVHQLGEYLQNNYSKNCDLETLLEKAINALYSEIISDNKSICDIPEYELPTFAIVIIRIENHKVSYYILGDCSIRYQHNNEIAAITDNRIEKFVKHNRKQMKLKMLDPRVDEEARIVYRETRKKANQEDGYSIGSIRGTGLKDGKKGEFIMTEGDKILLLSDGFHDYLTKCPSCIESFFDVQSIDKAIENMDLFLHDENEYKKAMRPKLVDDRSALLLSI